MPPTRTSVLKSAVKQPTRIIDFPPPTCSPPTIDEFIDLITVTNNKPIILSVEEYTKKRVDLNSEIQEFYSRKCKVHESCCWGACPDFTSKFSFRCCIKQKVDKFNKLYTLQ